MESTPNPPSIPSKPLAGVVRPELTRLPEYTWRRRGARRALHGLMRLIVATRLRLRVHGLENFPARGPALIAMNHLGDADIVIFLSQIRSLEVDALASTHLYDIPVLGPVTDLYGVIWLHRGHPDRRALNCALESLRRGRFVAIAPEGRESLAGGLEEGLNGAAFLALRADAPIVPIAVTGTENARVYRGLTRWPRLPASMTVGPSFRLPKTGDRRADLKSGTDRIMREIARLLPPEYRGIYREAADGL